MNRLHPIHNFRISADILDCLLEEFNNVINSKRLRSRIKQVGELIDVLWKRNIFQIDQNAVVTICKYLINSEQRDITRNYINLLSQNGRADNTENIYAIIRQNVQANVSANNRGEPRPSPSGNCVPQRQVNQNVIDADKRQTIFNIVCDNIDNWRDFGRCLGMKVVDLNRISQDLTLSNDIKQFLHRILEQMEEAYGNQFYEKLFNALCEARRKDIARSVKNIIQRPI